MNVSTMKDRMSVILPPVQPWLTASTADYVEKLALLNPINVKSNALFFQFTTGDLNNSNIQMLPEGCINILFNCNPTAPSASILGFLDQPYILNLEPHTTYFGVKPYSLFATRGWKVPQKEIFSNNRIMFYDTLNTNNLENKIAEAESFHKRIKLLQHDFIEFWLDESYTLSLEEYMAVILCLYEGNISVEEIAKMTGYSPRYCRKRFNSYYSISPKQYGRLVRFQGSLRMLLKDNKNDSYTKVAMDNGYFDESHFINDFRSYTSITPDQFRQSFLCNNSYIQ